MTTKLAKTETKLLLEAAERGGNLHLPETMKQITRRRLIGRLESDGLIVAAGADEAGPQLTSAGYKAVGLRPLRIKRMAKTMAVGLVGEPTTPSPAAKPPTKQALVVSLLGREGGATVPELIAATGWLPHTTRAALSRLRSAGNALGKSRREDGSTTYRLLAEAA